MSANEYDTVREAKEREFRSNHSYEDSVKDGEEVDGNKIDLDLYRYSYDEDSDTYYLTHK